MLNISILTFTGHYLPGYKGGGPIRTIASLVEALGKEFNFKIITLDHDLGCCDPYSGIKVNEWQTIGKAEVFYISPENLNWVFIRRTIMDTPHDILYLNSFLSVYFGIIPMVLRRFGLIPQKKTIVAPRGQFSAGALGLKSFKKRAYINLVKILRLHRGVIWQVSSGYEKRDLYRVFKNNLKKSSQLKTVIAPNLPDIQPLEIQKSIPKQPGTLNIVFLSRISPKKNLEGALNMISGLTGRITFNIFGPVEDLIYWTKCQKITKKLPPNIHVKYHGMVNHEDVTQVLSKHDIFFFPTLGENYGHVIIEAFAAGCPALISDKTPWRNLEEKGVGWDLPLDQPGKFKAILQQCVDMKDHEFSVYSSRARAYAQKKMMDPTVIQQNRNLFLNAN